MDGSQLELLASEVRRRARLDADENELATTIATRVLGPTGIALDPELAGAAYLRRHTDGGFQIVIRPTISDVRFAIMHELGHYAVREIARVRLTPIEEERAANFLAAAVLAPPEAVRRVYAHFGSDLRHLEAIAKTFGLSQTSAQLRLAEVIGDERAVVTANNGNVLVRGKGWKALPVLSVARGELRRPDIAKSTLRGGIDEGRIALRVR